MAALTGTVFAAALAIMTMVVVRPLRVAADDLCYADWSTAAPIVKAEGLVTVEELGRKARHHLEGVILKTQLCGDGAGHWRYRIIVREGDGKLRALTVDARRPFSE